MVLFKVFALLMASTASVNVIQQTEIHDNGEYADFGGYNSSESLKKIMLEQKGDFDQNLFDLMLTRKDISHLFHSDIENMLGQLQKEFPDIIKVRSIGQTWQKRDIMLIELDARDEMAKTGLKLTQVNKTEIAESFSQKNKKDDDEDDGEVHLSAKAGFSLVQTKKEETNNIDDSILVQTEADNTIQQKIKNLVQDIPDPLFLQDAIQSPPSDEQKPKEEAAASKEPEKSDIDLEKSKEDASKQSDEGQQLSQETKKPDADPKKAAEDDPAKLEEEAKKLEEETKKSEEETKKTEEATKETTEEAKKSSIDSVKQDNEDAQALMDQTSNREEETQKAKKSSKQASNKQEKISVKAREGDGNAILMTGATHARELLSMQVPLFECLKLIHNGYIHKNPKYQQMLRDQKFFFVPTVNVDGAALVEEHWISDRKILNKRKNMNPNLDMCGDENSGVDLNRNWGVDWQPEKSSNHTELCGDFWPGQEAFSEPESQALRDFIASERNNIKFVINCHTSGNEFIWPYNGREPNDIETRSPGSLQIFQDIAQNAHFPDGVMKGNSYEVIGDKMGGDADDYVLATFGIPSVTSEMGFFGQYIKDWQCQSKAVCFEIIKENSQWIEYVMSHITTIGDQVHPK